MKNNVHIYPSPILFESRIFRIVKCISELNVYDNIYILGISSKGLPESETLKKNIIIKRLNIKEDNWTKTGFINSAIKTIKLSILIFKFLVKTNPKVIHAHSLASLPISVFYKIFYTCKVVYDTHELETEREGWSRFTRIVSKIFEFTFIRFADITVVVNDGIADLYKKWYKINVISLLNAPEYSHFDLNNNYFRKKYKIKNKTKIFVYVGAFKEGRGVLRYIDFIKKTKLNICFIFIGFGKEEDRMNLLAQDSNKFFVHKAVKEDSLIKLICSADYALQTMSFEDNLSLSYKVALGNKFFQYCMVRLPMIGGGFDYQQKLIEQYNIGVTINNDDFQSIEKGIIKLLSMDLDLLKQNCKKVFEKYNWNNESTKIVNYYKKYIFK